MPRVTHNAENLPRCGCPVGQAAGLSEHHIGLFQIRLDRTGQRPVRAPHRTLPVQIRSDRPAACPTGQPRCDIYRHPRLHLHCYPPESGIPATILGRYSNLPAGERLAIPVFEDRGDERDTGRRIVRTLEPTHIPFIPFIYVQKLFKNKRVCLTINDSRLSQRQFSIVFAPFRSFKKADSGCTGFQFRVCGIFCLTAGPDTG